MGHRRRCGTHGVHVIRLHHVHMCLGHVCKCAKMYVHTYVCVHLYIWIDILKCVYTCTYVTSISMMFVDSCHIYVYIHAFVNCVMINYV